MSSNNDQSFAKRLIDIRKRREFSQSELARKAGMQPSAIAHFESGRRKPSFLNIRELAKALSVTTDYLLGIQETGTTAFRDEESLSAKDREYIQGIIDMMVDKKD